MASRSSQISQMFKERQEKKEEVEGRQHGETKTTTHGRRGENETTLYWNADTKKWQRQFIRKKPPTGEEQDARLREESNKVKREKIEKQRESGDIFPDLRGGEGDIPAPIRLQKELEQREAFEDESGANEWGPDGQPSASDQIAFQGSNTGGQGNKGRTGDDGEQVNYENKEILKEKLAQYHKSISWDGMNRTYTSDYREAVKNAAGWSKFYDDQDEAGNPIEKSDVFTRGEDGQPLGVMTRSQRRAYDMRMHEAKMSSMNAERDGAIEREESEWGPEGQPTASEQIDVTKGSKPETVKPVETISEKKPLLGKG